jgi:hypothetical protein
VAVNFPVSLDTLTNPAGTQTLDNPDHAEQHANANDIVEALEAKVGIDSSAVTTSHDYKLSTVTGSDKAVSVAGTQTLTSKTLTSPTITTGVVATSLDMNGTKLILDADADTSITADTDDQIDVEIAAADDFRFTANLFAALPGSAIRTPSATAFKSRNNADGADIDLIAANSSDQTTIGQNSVRATRFVMIDPSVTVLNTNPGDTNWNDLDVTSTTSANTFAIAATMAVNASSADRSGFARVNGSSDAQGILTVKVEAPIAGVTHTQSFIVGVDTGQILEWSVDNADVAGFRIVINGYWEYVD